MEKKDRTRNTSMKNKIEKFSYQITSQSSFIVGKVVWYLVTFLLLEVVYNHSDRFCYVSSTSQFLFLS